MEYSFYGTTLLSLVPNHGAAVFDNRLVALLKAITLPEGIRSQAVFKCDESSRLSFIRVGQPEGRCSVTGKPLSWWGRKFLVSPQMTDGEIVQTVFLACKVALEHELRAAFKFNGQAVFDPHFDIEKLVELRARGDALKEREI